MKFVRHVIFAAAGSALLATPAMAALKVTNLSPETRTVVFDSAGSVSEHVIAPNRTAFISGSDGRLSLKGATPTAGDGNIIGTRSNFFGHADTARSQGAPASQMDEFVIWPDGRLLFQKRQKGSRNNR